MTYVPSSPRPELSEGSSFLLHLLAILTLACSSMISSVKREEIAWQATLHPAATPNDGWRPVIRAVAERHYFSLWGRQHARG